MKKLLSAAAVAALMSAPAMAAEIKVGSVAGITGPIAELVTPILAARKMAADDINAQGGLLKGDKMVLVAGDARDRDALELRHHPGRVDHLGQDRPGNPEAGQELVIPGLTMNVVHQGP